MQAQGGRVDPLDPADQASVLRLFTALLNADREEEAVEILQAAGVWDDPALWRLYGDEEDNFSAAGNQQRNPVAALVEKAINAVDAGLMGKVLAAGISPRSTDAPSTPREAVAIFYEGAEPGNVHDHQGRMANWTPQQRTAIARDITIALTGEISPRPSISIADAGEGQAPEALSTTILSLLRGIKKNIPFVQGKFNMGGTGALRFCGHYNLQLVVSKRSPAIRSREGSSADWGFTIVRRDDPSGSTRVSTYRYLAPIGADEHPTEGGVLRIERNSLPIFPEGQRPYARESEWGTLIKLYEYDTGIRVPFFRRDGLLGRLDIMMPGLMLPIRLHECRPYKGAAGSFETTLTGLEVRLRAQEGGEGNLENGFPDSGFITIAYQRIDYTIYAFKSGRSETYKKNEGVLFVVNGQTHAHMQDRMFARKDVGLGYIARSLLVVLDCTGLTDRTKEDLFMNSRDRLADADLARRIDGELTDLLRNHSVLRELVTRRRQEEVSERISDSKPLEDVLRSMLKRSPTLAKLFLTGTRLSNPFATVKKPVAKEFRGRRHPTFFRFKGHDYGYVLKRDAHLGQRLRLTFETDVANDYFRRNSQVGTCLVEAELNGSGTAADSNVNLHDGLAHLNLGLPANARPGDSLRVTATVTDETLVEPFINTALLTIAREVQPTSGPPKPRQKRTPPDPAGKTDDRPSGITLPEVKWVKRGGWQDEKFGENPMDRFSALRAVQAAASNDGAVLGAYVFYLNEDNDFLATELKASPRNSDLLRARYQYGMTLAGMAAVKYGSEKANGTSGGDEAEAPWTIEGLVAATTDVLAPMLLPMIDSLGGLDMDAFEEAALEEVETPADSSED